MAERITEDLVRDHFKADPIFDQTNFEEQKSSRDRLQKLFANASKNQTGRPGYPEFIISFNDKPNVLLIVECKYDKVYHESNDRDDPRRFAVDGVLHYIKFANIVDNGFDLIGIAVSGAEITSLDVTYFYSPAGSINYSETSDTKLLSIHSYLKIHENEKFARQLSNVHIQQKAVEYNNALHQHEIPEHERCTFISAVLVALQDDFFRSTYRKSANVQDLISQVIRACDEVLKKNKIIEDRRERLMHEGPVALYAESRLRRRR